MPPGPVAVAVSDAVADALTIPLLPVLTTGGWLPLGDTVTLVVAVVLLPKLSVTRSWNDSNVLTPGAVKVATAVVSLVSATAGPPVWVQR